MQDTPGCSDSAARVRDSAARIRRHGVLRFGGTGYAGNSLECAIRRHGAGSVIVAEVASTPPRANSEHSVTHSVTHMCFAPVKHIGAQCDTHVLM